MNIDRIMELADEYACMWSDPGGTDARLELERAITNALGATCIDKGDLLELDQATLNAIKSSLTLPRPSDEWYRRKLAEIGDNEPGVIGAGCFADTEPKLVELHNCCCGTDTSPCHGSDGVPLCCTDESLASAQGDEPKAVVPMNEIGELLAEAMDIAVKNGANSISMPDEYVAIAHFVCYPEEYGFVPAAVDDEPAQGAESKVARAARKEGAEPDKSKDAERNSILEEAALLCESDEQCLELGRLCAVALRGLK